MAAIQFENVTKQFDDGTRAVHSLDLAIRDGELMVLVGPSGCGKTTALRMVAGLEDLSGGSIRIGDRVVNDLPPKERDVAMVFQNYALYPHLNVAQNIAFGLKLRKTPKDEIERRVTSVARVLGLQELLTRKPKALSGGQRQRVAMGRAIVRQPEAFLMDEPLSNLDAKLRVEMRAEIIRLQRELHATTVYVTHDQVEAMTMGDRVGVMRAGILQQVDEPQVLYDRPVNLFVATFIGSPAMNTISGRIATSGGGLVVHAGSQEIPLAPEMVAARPALNHYVGREVVVGIRPEHLEDASLLHDGSSGARIRGVLELREALGSDILAHVVVDAPPAPHTGPHDLAADSGAPLHQGSKSVLVGRLSAESTVREGDAVELTISTRKLQIFDPTSGDAVFR